MQLQSAELPGTAIVTSHKCKVDAVFTNNPHVKHFRAEPIDEQVQKLDASAEMKLVCLYPSPAVLAQVVDRSLYDGRPFTLRLALGDGQLEFRAFDLMVLEHYRNDRRYHYRSDEVTLGIAFGAGPVVPVYKARTDRETNRRLWDALQALVRRWTSH